MAPHPRPSQPAHDERAFHQGVRAHCLAHLEPAELIKRRDQIKRELAMSGVFQVRLVPDMRSTLDLETVAPQ